MSEAEFRALLGDLTPAQKDRALAMVFFCDELLFARACTIARLDHCPQCAHRYGTGCGDPCCAPLPPRHGENHVDNAGHVISACQPGECITCHGTVDAGGVFHPAVTA